jgi:hypothetical protein
MSSLTGTDITTYKDLKRACGYIHYAQLNGKKLKFDWTPENHENCVQVQRASYFYRSFGSSDLWKIGSSAFYIQLEKQINDIISGKPNSPKLALYSAHDTNISLILNGLGLIYIDQAQEGSQLLFEVFETNRVNKIRVIMNDEYLMWGKSGIELTLFFDYLKARISMNEENSNKACDPVIGKPSKIEELIFNSLNLATTTKVPKPKVEVVKEVPVEETLEKETEVIEEEAIQPEEKVTEEEVLEEVVEDEEVDVVEEKPTKPSKKPLKEQVVVEDDEVQIVTDADLEVEETDSEETKPEEVKEEVTEGVKEDEEKEATPETPPAPVQVNGSVIIFMLVLSFIAFYLAKSAIKEIEDEEPSLGDSENATTNFGQTTRKDENYSNFVLAERF